VHVPVAADGRRQSDSRAIPQPAPFAAFGPPPQQARPAAATPAPHLAPSPTRQSSAAFSAPPAPATRSSGSGSGSIPKTLHGSAPQRSANRELPPQAPQPTPEQKRLAGGGQQSGVSNLANLTEETIRQKASRLKKCTDVGKSDVPKQNVCCGKGSELHTTVLCRGYSTLLWRQQGGDAAALRVQLAESQRHNATLRETVQEQQALIRQLKAQLTAQPGGGRGSADQVRATM